MGLFVIPGLTQSAPPTTLLNAPPLVAAYNVRGLCGSIESASIQPPWGPMLVHALVPAQTLPVPRMANTVVKAITWFQLDLFMAPPLLLAASGDAQAALPFPACLRVSASAATMAPAASRIRL